ncbi:hypothetical protein [Bifidobacterium aquikefiri]|uniref:hypothetical protein n=1 Tax=Bifidobacterium aquikefiri TaxID=1653207 RepID=UPI0039E7C1C0
MREGNEALREQRLIDAIGFLIAFKIATADQLHRAIYRKTASKGSASTKFIRKIVELGYIQKSQGFGMRTLYSAAPGMEAITAWGAPKAENMATKSAPLQAHALALTSIASQILTAPEHDPMGVGDTTWERVRSYVKNRHATLLGETQYRTAWSAMLTEDEQSMRDAYNDTDTIVNAADNATIEGDAFGLWAWVVACKGLAYDTNTGEYYAAASFQEGGSTYLLKDHIPDMVLTFDAQKHYAIAVEMELNTKTTKDYIRTLAEYQSPIGRALYQRVVWLYDRTTTGTYLQRAIDAVGNKGGQIILRRVQTTNGQGMHVWSGADVMLSPESTTHTVRKQAPKHAQENDAANMFAALLDDDTEGETR